MQDVDSVRIGLVDMGRWASLRLHAARLAVVCLVLVGSASQAQVDIPGQPLGGPEEGMLDDLVVAPPPTVVPGGGPGVSTLKEPTPRMDKLPFRFQAVLGGDFAPASSRVGMSADFQAVFSVAPKPTVGFRLGGKNLSADGRSGFADFFVRVTPLALSIAERHQVELSLTPKVLFGDVRPVEGDIVAGVGVSGEVQGRYALLKLLELRLAGTPKLFNGQASLSGFAYGGVMLPFGLNAGLKLGTRTDGAEAQRTTGGIEASFKLNKAWQLRASATMPLQSPRDTSAGLGVVATL